MTDEQKLEAIRELCVSRQVECVSGYDGRTFLTDADTLWPSEVLEILDEAAE